MITIVSGLPRSGTSLMMQILKAGGIEPLTDYARKEDENNLKGYYEYEKVKSLHKDNQWLNEAEGKSVKVIAQLIHYLPMKFNYNVIFMERNMDEIMQSQAKMLSQMGGNKPGVPDDVLKKVFTGQVAKVKDYLAANRNFQTVYVNYNELIINSSEIITKINSQLNLNLRVTEAAKQVDSSLYRNRLEDKS